MTATVRKITADLGDACEVDVDVLHDRIISQLPAEIYIGLFQRMQMKIYGCAGFPNYVGNYCAGSCGDSVEYNKEQISKNHTKDKKQYNLLSQKINQSKIQKMPTTE